MKHREEESPEAMIDEEIERRSPGREAAVENARRVLEADFSRNRHFDFYDSPEGRVLRHFRRVIQGLVADLERAGPDEPVHYEVEPGTGRVLIELYIPRYRSWRRSYLSEAEFEAIRAHPQVGPRLALREAA